MMSGMKSTARPSFVVATAAAGPSENAHNTGAPSLVAEIFRFVAFRKLSCNRDASGGMKRILSLAALWVLGVTVVLAGERTDLTNARRAQAVLGADVWSQVIRIENSGSTQKYARTVHALVFEVAGILWLYHDSEGSQSFSLHRGRLEAEKADFAPLLADIHAGFTRWSVMTTTEPVAVGAPGTLLNGCFVESIANLRHRVIGGGVANRPKLLSYFYGSARIRPGHTVLTFETDDGVVVIDPVEPSRLRVFSNELAKSATALSTALLGRMVSKALFVPVGDFAAEMASRYSGVSVTATIGRPPGLN